jgi:hypothetical protein
MDHITDAFLLFVNAACCWLSERLVFFFFLFRDSHFPISSLRTKIKIYKTVILSLLLYGCEPLFLKLKEGHKLRVTENRVLRRIFGSKR